MYCLIKKVIFTKLQRYKVVKLFNNLNKKSALKHYVLKHKNYKSTKFIIMILRKSLTVAF